MAARGVFRWLIPLPKEKVTALSQIMLRRGEDLDDFVLPAAVGFLSTPSVEDVFAEYRSAVSEGGSRETKPSLVTANTFVESRFGLYSSITDSPSSVTPPCM